MNASEPDETATTTSKTTTRAEISSSFASDARTTTVSLWLVAIVAVLGGINNGFNGALTVGLVPRLDDALDGHKDDDDGGGGMSDIGEGLLAASLFAGGCVGTVLGGYGNERHGRKRTTIAGETIIVVGYGICAVTKPLYISELVDTATRGFAVSIFSVSFSIGINIVNLCEEILPEPSSSSSWIAEQSWRLEIFVGSLPAFGLLLVVYTCIPESPYWKGGNRVVNSRTSSSRINSKEKKDARSGRDEDDGNEAGDTARVPTTTYPTSTFTRVDDDDDDDETARLVGKRHHQSPRVEDALRRALAATFVMSVALELTLIAVYMGYTQSFLERLGVSESSSTEFAFVISGTHLVGVLVALVTIDSVGRRPLLFSGYLGMIFFMSVMIANEQIGGSEHRSWEINVLSLSGVVLFFQIGPSTCFWVQINEIFPLRYRAIGNAFGIFAMFAWCIVVMFVYPIIEDSVSVTSLMLFNIAVTVACATYLYPRLPESKGVSLDRVSVMWQRWRLERDNGEGGSRRGDVREARSCMDRCVECGGAGSLMTKTKKTRNPPP